jgi:hypothetical protein
MIAGVGEGVGDDAADDGAADDAADGVALGETLGDDVPDGELAEDPPADGFADVDVQAAARAAIATAHSPDRILEATPM